ncbi:MAG: T9SS type A sorting domain-containing protein [Chitinophagaceae bacterium]
MKPLISTRTKSLGIGFILTLLIPLVSSAQPVNDICANATPVNSFVTCGALTGQGLRDATLGPATATAGILAFCGNANSPDVWYSFTAYSTSTTITLSNIGATLLATRRLQIFGPTTCTPVANLNAASLQCVAASTLTQATVVGQTYLIRVFTNGPTAAGTFAQWAFDICVQDAVAPVNNTCAGVISLTSALACNNTLGTLAGATSTAGINAFCGNAASPDVWYSFTAQTPYPVITLSSIGANLDNSPRLQIFNTTSCIVGTQNTSSLACVSGTNTATLVLDAAVDVGGLGLTVGNTYLVRVFSNSTTTPGSSASWGYNICIQDPTPPVPSNDDCNGAITLPVGTGCGNIAGTMLGATNSGIATGCPGPVSYDVWYKFVAVNAVQTITLGGGANNFTSRRLELMSGTCGGVLTSVQCGTNSIITAGLTPGTTYYIRVYSNSGTAAPSTNGAFTMCITTASATIPPRFGNSYVNLSKKNSGGVVQQGDTLEIRMTINYSGNATLFKARYVDNIPTNTQMLSGTADSIRVITNEGITFRRYTPTPNTNNDAATYLTAPVAPAYAIKMNIGFSNAPGNVGTINTEGDITGAVDIVSSDRPRGGGGVLFATAFRVVVTGNPNDASPLNDTIKFGTGKFIYRTSSGGSDIALSTTPYQILISNPLSLCNNAIGLNAAQESGGTFGSGNLLNRATDLVTPITGYTFIQQSSGQGIGDGQYGIVKNMSPRNGLFRNANKQPSCGAPPPALDCNNRMHGGFWDVDGDHTGTNNSIGNIPPDAGDPGGYMLVVNADYIASEVYRQSLTGLCPSTYYEFSAWTRNICTPCGLDSSGTQRFNPGVYPNLTFSLDGLDRYSTGQIDTLGWIKKGFVFLTGPSQTAATFIIRNNSQGGGGNDWALDDIAVATCLPNMVYSPSNNPTVCVMNASNISDTVRSFFNNYVYYKWQRSTDGGLSYVDITFTQGPVTPVFNVALGLYQYVTNYGVPPSQATMANNGDLYRVIAATTPGNLGSTNCVVTNGISFVTLNVLNCGTPLKTDLLSFNGKLVVDKANLTWITSKEEEAVKYFIERSSDGINFTRAGTLDGYNSPGNTTNQYSFVDPLPVNGKVYYRVMMAASTNNKKYSRIVELSLLEKNLFAITNVVNPFNQALGFNINSPVDAKIDAELVDMFGKVVKRKTYLIHSGVSTLNIPETESLSTGTYILRITNNEQILSRKVLKKNL